MALLRKNDTADLSDAAIPDPAVDPDYSRALELLSAFNQRYDRLEKEKQRLRLEAHFAGRSAEKDDYTNGQLRIRLSALRAEPPLKPELTAAPAAPSPAITRGLAVLAGETITPAPSYAAQVADLDRQLAILDPAIREQTEVCSALLGDLSVEYARRLLPAWNAKVLAVFRAAQELSRATTQFREYRAAVMARNIKTELLRAPNVVSPLQLGSETDWNSEISHWRRTLESWNVL